MNIQQAMELKSSVSLIISEYEKFLAREAADGAQPLRAVEALYSREISRNIAATSVFQKRVAAIAEGDAALKLPTKHKKDDEVTVRQYSLSTSEVISPEEAANEKKKEQEELARLDKEIDERYDLTSGLDPEYFTIDPWKEGDPNPRISLEGGIYTPRESLPSGTAHFGFANPAVDDYFSLSFNNKDGYSGGTRLFKDLSDCIPCMGPFAEPELEWRKLRDLLAADWNQRWKWYKDMLALFAGPKNSKTIAQLCSILEMFKNLCPQDISRLIAALVAWINRLIYLIDFNLATALSDILAQILRPYIQGIDAWLMAFWKAVMAPINCIIDNIQAQVLSMQSIDITTYTPSSANIVYNEKNPVPRAVLAEQARSAMLRFEADPSDQNLKKWGAAETALARADEKVAPTALYPGSNIDRDKTTRPRLESSKYSIYKADEETAKSIKAANSQVDAWQKKLNEDPLGIKDDIKALQAMLKKATDGIIGYVEENVARLQQTLIEMLHLEWGVATKRLTLMQNVQMLIEILAILKAIEKVIRTGEVKNLCSGDTARLVLDIMSGQSPDPFIPVLSPQSQMPSTAETSEDELSLSRSRLRSASNVAADVPPNAIRVDLTSCGNTSSSGVDIDRYIAELANA